MPKIFLDRAAVVVPLTVLAGLISYLTDPDCSRFSLLAAGASVLFWAGWIWFLWNAGKRGSSRAVGTLLLYAGVLSAAVAFLDTAARFGWFSSLLPVYLRMFSGMLLFGANYLMTYLLTARLGMSEWWGTAAFVLVLLGVWKGARKEADSRR